MDPKSCNPNPQWVGHGANEYGTVGFCRCKRFVAHESNTVCNVIETIDDIDYLPRPDDCECKATVCSCGEFLSHGVLDKCTAKPLDFIKSI